MKRHCRASGVDGKQLLHPFLPSFFMSGRGYWLATPFSFCTDTRREFFYGSFMYRTEVGMRFYVSDRGGHAFLCIGQRWAYDFLFLSRYICSY